MTRPAGKHLPQRRRMNGHFRSSIPSVSTSATKMVGAPPKEIETA